MRDFALKVNRDGTLVGIYDDELQPLFTELGQPIIRRASHVEPTKDGQWTADMGPIGGPVLGPFSLRGEALQAERAWLERRLL
jgi:hypothetical protein